MATKELTIIGKDFIYLPLRNSLLAVVIVFSILINAFIPRFALSQEDSDVFSQIMQQQTTLLKFFSLSTIPLDIVNQLFAQGQNVQAAAKKDTAEKKKNRKTNNSADFSIISLEKTQNISKPNSLRQNAGDLVSIFFNAFSPFNSNIRGSPPTINPHTFIFCAFLLLFFLLPRNSTNDTYAIILTIASKYTQLGFPSWVFYCQINSLIEVKL